MPGRPPRPHLRPLLPGVREGDVSEHADSGVSPPAGDRVVVPVDETGAAARGLGQESKAVRVYQFLTRSETLILKVCQVSPGRGLSDIEGGADGVVERTADARVQSNLRCSRAMSRGLGPDFFAGRFKGIMLLGTFSSVLAGRA
jgi:hypothetical protein